MDDKFRAALYKVFQNNGHSKPRARALYEEVEDAIEELLVDGELRIKGLLTVKVTANMEKVFDGFSGDPMKNPKVVVRAGATVRPRLRTQVQERWAKLRAVKDDQRIDEIREQYDRDDPRAP